MKKTTKRFMTGCIAVALAAVTAFGGFGPAVAQAANSAPEEINYVSLGASNTNGYGIRGYLPEEVSEDPLAASKADMNVYGYLMAPEAAYPAQVAEALGDTNGPDQLAISSMRVEEVRYLLDDTMDPDAYMEWRFTGGQKWFEIAEPGGIDKLKEAYKAYLKDADYVTVDLGWNNFGVYAFNNIKTILADGTYWKAPDWDKYPEEEEMYKTIREAALAKLSENMPDSNGSLKDKLELMADVLVYTTLGACYDYDIVMEKIYELNPDATVVVINIQNLADDLVVEFEGETLKLGDIYGELIDLVNLYRASESPYADKCVYVDAGDVETFLDELVAWDGDPTNLSVNMKDCFDMYDDNLYVRSIIEYMLVGQALSGLFDGFRTMAADNGLELFEDDDTYTYEFALTRTPEQLLALDLSKLDLNNPAGEDADVEEYGKALAKHLKNLRGDKANVAAYDYVFENLLSSLKNQKSELEIQLEDLKEKKSQLEPVKADEPYASQYSQVVAGIMEYEAGIAQLAQAIDEIIPEAKTEFATKLNGVYNTYHNTLNYAYDVVATIFQEAAKKNTLTIDASSLDGYNNVSDDLVKAISGSFVNGAQNKFYYELQKNGVQNTGVTENPEVNVDDVLTLMEGTPAMTAIAVLAVRYDLGNSFFAHPNENGHDQITEAVMDAIKNGSDADDFTDSKLELYTGFIKEKYPNLYEVLMGVQNVSAGEMDDLAIIINMLKLSGSTGMTTEELDALEAQIRAAQRDFAEGKTPEEQASAKAIVEDLMGSLYDMATITSGTNYEATEDSYYVSLGDSTLTGYGLESYVDGVSNGAHQAIAESAHVLLAKNLYGDSWKNQFGLLTQGALRAEDLLLFLGGDVVTDDYYDQEIEPNLMNGETTGVALEDTQDYFIESVKKADLISVAIGGGNIFTFVGKQMNRVMDPETNGDPYELDWERIGMDSEAMAELNELLDVAVPMVDELGLLDQYVPEEMGTLEDPAKFARALVETTLYGYASYNYYYPQVLEKIKEINPDAELIVMGMFNPVDNWSMTTTIEGEEVYVPIGGAIGNLIDSANLQNLAFALQNSKTTFVDIGDTETILEAENPGKELTFTDYYDSSFKSNGKAVHASIAGHEYIYSQMKAGLTTETQIYIVLEEMYYLIETYGPMAYENAYDYAEAEGYIDEAIAGIDAAIAELEAIRAELERVESDMTDEFRAEALKEIDEIIETLESAKTLILEADVLDQATLDALLSLLNEAGEAMVQLYESLEQAAVDVNQLAIIPALKETHAVLVNEVIPQIEKNLKKAVEEGTAWLMEKAEEAYNAMVEAITEAAKEYAPEVADYIYNWLLNNPDKVIAFFEEYGDDIVAFMEEYQEEIFTVLGFLISEFGDDVVNYVMENPEEVLDTLVWFYEEHGEKTWELIKVYADALGITAALEAKAAEVYEALEAICNYIESELEEIIEAEIAKIEAEIEALKAELEKAGEDAKAVIEAEIARLEAELEALVAQLEAYLENAFNELYVDATTGEYVVDGDSKYLALGDSVAASKNSFAGKLADELAKEYKVDDYTDLSMAGFRTEDIRYILDEAYELDAYGQAKTKAKADKIRAEYIAAIEESDLITITLGNDNFSAFVADQIGARTYEMDWERYVTEDGVPYVEEKLAEIRAEVTKAIPNPILSKRVEKAVEAYAYGFAGFAGNYTQVLNEIHEINPDAQVVVVGMFNPMDALTMNMDGEDVALGEYVDYFISMSNQMFTVYSAITPNTTFVPVPDTEVVMDADVEKATYIDYVWNLLQASDELLPSDAGYTYIKDQIMNAMTITSGYLKGDVNLDGKVNAADTTLLYDYVLRKSDLVTIQLLNADVTEEGDVNAADTTKLYDYVLRRIASL